MAGKNQFVYAHAEDPPAAEYKNQVDICTYTHMLVHLAIFHSQILLSSPIDHNLSRHNMTGEHTDPELFAKMLPNSNC